MSAQQDRAARVLAKYPVRSSVNQAQLAAAIPEWERDALSAYRRDRRPVGGPIQASAADMTARGAAQLAANEALDEAGTRSLAARIERLEAGLLDAAKLIEGIVLSEPRADRGHEDDPDWQFAQRLRALAEGNE